MNVLTIIEIVRFKESPSSQIKVKEYLSPKNIYGTLPRNQLKTHVLVTDANIDDISGNLNEVSGSVITSISNNVNIDKSSKPDQIKPKGGYKLVRIQFFSFRFVFFRTLRFYNQDFFYMSIELFFSSQFKKLILIFVFIKFFFGQFKTKHKFKFFKEKKILKTPKIKYL